MSINKAVVRNKTVSYRDGAHTSKVTIQPAIYESLVRHFNDEKSAYSFISGMAAQAHSEGKKQLSGYIQDYVLNLVFPNNLTDGYSPSAKRVDVRFFDPVNKRPTKLVTFGALEHALNAISGGKSAKIHADAAAAYIEKTVGEDRGRDVSFEVREQLIRNISLMC